MMEAEVGGRSKSRGGGERFSFSLLLYHTHAYRSGRTAFIDNGHTATTTLRRGRVTRRK